MGPEWNCPISVRQNADVPVVWGFASGTVQSSTPFTFAGSTATLIVTKDENSTVPLLTLSSNTGGLAFGTIVVQGVTLGTITANFTHGLTVNMAPGAYYYDILVSNSGVNGYYALGTFNLKPSVSR